MQGVALYHRSTLCLQRDNKRHSNQKYIKKGSRFISTSIVQAGTPHPHTWGKTFEPIRMLKSCCLDTMKNNSCTISEATNESPRPPNLIVLYTRITATAPFYSTQAMVEPTSVSQNNRTSYISSLATIYNCNVRGK